MDAPRVEDGLHTGRSKHPSESTLNQLETPVIESGDPGSPPFTRGIYSGMYLDKLWTMRQYAGFSDTKSTNQRFQMMLGQGQSGLSVAFDLPTQLGLDSDDELSNGEVGKVGVPIDTIHDMRALFNGIKLDEVSTSMTINAPATSIFAMYVALADEQGIAREQLRGTVQNDILKEYIARGLYIFPPSQSLRLTTDLMNWCANNAPKWNTISVSGYHMREAGCTATQEIGFTLSNGIQYIDSAISSGLEIDDFAPRMSFFFGCHNDFFEEIAKFRAARTLWHDIVTERYSPNNPKSTMLRFHTQTAGVTLTAQQPLNNSVRVAYQALASVLGGTQSLHTNSFDEAIGLPTENSAQLALRTQQIIANETRVTESVDPLAGSYLIEELTSKLYHGAKHIIDNLDTKGGALNCVISGLQQREIHDSAWLQLKAIENMKTNVVGVNVHNIEEENTLSAQSINPENVKIILHDLELIKQKRNEEDVIKSLEHLLDVARSESNVMEAMIDAYKCEATLGEVNSVLREVFGTWISPSGV
jgi:methylmalonyl-CoA mutase N-terminal domain/subunit